MTFIARCPECGGNGFPDDYPDRECPMCFGSGEVQTVAGAVAALREIERLLAESLSEQTGRVVATGNVTAALDRARAALGAVDAAH